MRVFLAVLLCKLSRFALRIMGRGGTNLPGRLAVKLCPELLRHLATDVRCIVVTGTNGKTTTSRIIEQAYELSGTDYFSNRSGANLLTGITAEFAANATLFGGAKKHHAVIECDEAASKLVCQYIDPAVVLVTNVFRDQLDRYGEVTHTLENIKIGVTNAANAVICLNADDSLSASIGLDIPNRVLYYGLDMPIYSETAGELSDAVYCIRCKTEYEYGYVTYAHLGSYHCPECGYTRADTEVAVTAVESLDADSSSVTIRLPDGEHSMRVNLPGGYNIYNAVGAAAALIASGFDSATVLKAADAFNCGFGRMEKFDLDGHETRMILIKNPAGCNQALSYISGLDCEALLAVCLNDRIADGTDISWIWDANFEKLSDNGNKVRLGGILVAGIRADDMAVRLKYAGLSAECITIVRDYDEFLRQATSQDRPIFILPTYTAMLELRDKISSVYGYGNFWD